MTQDGKSDVSGRLLHAHTVGYKSTESCPSLRTYEKDDAYKNLITAMKEMADTYGKLNIEHKTIGSPYYYKNDNSKKDHNGQNVEKNLYQLCFSNTVIYNIFPYRAT